MTVCVAVSVDDGIVFAADSAATFLTVDENGRSVVANVYRHGNKVFNLCRGLPICAMTAGMGSIGRAPIHALAKDFRQRLAPGQEYAVDPTNYSIEKIVNDARKFLFEDRYRKLETPPPPPHSLEFWIGGFSTGAEQPELWKINITDGNCAAPENVRPVGDCGLNWGGQPDPINRLLIGFAQATGDALLEAGVAPEQLPNLLGVIQAKTQAPLVVPAMPIQDAIELADFLVDMTKKFFRFYPGADVVGGETDIAVVTRHEKFKWVKRKHYYSTDLNPTELDHV